METSKLQKAEAELQRNQEFTRSVVESSVDWVSVLDLGGQFLYISPSGLNALKIESAAEQVGRLWTDVWATDDQKLAEAALDAARAGEVGKFAGKLSDSNDQASWWDVRVTPAHDHEGCLERFIVIMRDITELRLAQQAAVEAEKQAVAGRMAATIAHEINNPLEAVTNYIYLAQTTEGLPEDARRHLEVADQELARAAQITRQTLGFYRGASRPMQSSVADLISAVLAIFSRRIRAKQITTMVSVDPSLEISGKDGELRQILLNIVANALDACSDGGNVWIRAHCAPNWKTGDDKNLRITIADDGMGMAPEVRRRIFHPFFTTKSASGTGIGLWVTKCLVEQLGGSIRFRSRQGKNSGTVMSVLLQAARNRGDEREQVA